MQADYITLYRNFYCDNSTRNNKIKGINQYANNVVYNWKNGCYIMGGDSSGTSWCQIEGNLFVNGPSTGTGNALGGGNSDHHYYGADNWQDNNKDGIFNPWSVEGAGQTGGGKPEASLSVIESGAGVSFPALPLYAGSELLERNIPVVGASLPYRDQADCYMVDEVLSHGSQGSIITYESSLPIGTPLSWDWYNGETRTDSDGDGMPDAWEDANGTNKSVDDALTLASNGYYNIENYINSITADDRQFFLRKPILPYSIGKTTTTITVGWRDYTEGEDGFSIEYQPYGASSWTVAGMAAANATSYTLENLTIGTYYNIRIRAYATVNGTKQYSAYSQTVKLYTSQGDVEEVDIATYAPDLIYNSRHGGVWSKFDNTQGIATTFWDGAKVLLNTEGDNSLTVTADIAPKSIVANGTGKFSVIRAGWMTGAMSVNKGNTGTLAIIGQSGKKDSLATYTGAVVNHGGVIEFDSIANGGSASALGASQSFPDNWVFDGGTYRYTGGDASTDRNALLRTNGDATNTLELASATLKATGVFEGESDFALAGAGTLSIGSADFFGYTGATILRGSTLYLSNQATCKNFAPHQLVMAGGTLVFSHEGTTDDVHKFPIDAVDGTTSHMTLPSKGKYNGRLSGSGTLQFTVPYCRYYMDANFDEFDGRIVAYGTSLSDRVFMPTGSWNAPNVTFTLKNKINMGAWETNADNYIGGLSGDSGTRLIGSSKDTKNFKCKWIVGSANTDETFNGIINNLPSGLNSAYSGTTSITKVGTGDWKLTGANTYSGATTINGGRLLICGNHTGTGAVTVNNGATLRGTGKIAGAVTVNSGGVVHPGDGSSSSSLTTNGSITFNKGAILKSGTSLYANAQVKINSGAILQIDTTEKTLKSGTSIQVFKGAFNFSGTFSAIEPASPGEGLAWDSSTLYTDGLLKVYSTESLKNYFIGTNGSYWDQSSSWSRNAVPEAGMTAIFTNAAPLTVNMGLNSDACICDEIQLNGADVIFQPIQYWPRLSPKEITGTGAMHLLAADDRTGEDTTAVGLVSQDATNMLVRVPVYVESTATIQDQDVFFQGLNGHTVNFYRPVTVAEDARLVVYGGMYLRGGFVVNSTKWNSLRGDNWIASELSGPGNIYLEENPGTTYFSGDNAAFTGTISQQLHSCVPRFMGGASAPANGTVDINGDIYIIPGEYGETFRFGALNLHRADWFFAYVAKNMGVKLEVCAKGDSLWEDGYYFCTYDIDTGATSVSETTDAKIIKTGAATTLWAYAKQFDNNNLIVKRGYCVHERWTQDFEDAATYTAQITGGTVKSDAFGTSEAAYALKGTVDQAERTIYNSTGTSRFFRIFTKTKHDTNGAIFTMPDKVANASKGYKIEFDYFLSQVVTDVCSGMIIQGSNGILATIYAPAGAKETESTNGGVYIGDSTLSANKIATIKSWARGTDPASEAARKYWKHYVIAGVPSGPCQGVYLMIYSSAKREDGTPDVDLEWSKISDTYDTIKCLNLVSTTTRYDWDRYLCLDNVEAYYPEGPVPYVSGDDDAEIDRIEDGSYVIKPGAQSSNIAVCIPDGVEAGKVTVLVPVTASTIEPNGAKVRVLSGEYDITDYLDLPSDSFATIYMANVDVKQEVADEALDLDKGATVVLSGGTPTITTSPTKKGLTYRLLEGRTLEAMANSQNGDSTPGDGYPWTPEISITGGNAAFYSISVGK
ncbi:MAG: autotransporter-associated beta strand repeat-containing protein [Kiritimatiellae bacterium]|nr:autotransporter-associated beta strand repeat-containing protein [Kiritimatiellia bacterium]